MYWSINRLKDYLGPFYLFSRVVTYLFTETKSKFQQNISLYGDKGVDLRLINKNVSSSRRQGTFQRNMRLTIPSTNQMLNVTKGLINPTLQFVTITYFITKTQGQKLTVLYTTKPNKYSSRTKTSLSVAVRIICHVSQINRSYFISQWNTP